MHALNAKKLKEESWMLRQIHAFATKLDSLQFPISCNAESAFQPARNARMSPDSAALNAMEASTLSRMVPVGVPPALTSLASILA